MTLNILQKGDLAKYIERIGLMDLQCIGIMKFKIGEEMKYVRCSEK
jgi:hypothetical protein